ncbi:MAG: hypothetical protein M2R45_03021 [Verrucomicrobia subdivision 3 bacterium]|nr:hypothetical protein [Limisphaerales bacterium]MCS1415541.1 hypothetical protein [Limisphaerales bacterium]
MKLAFNLVLGLHRTVLAEAISFAQTRYPRSQPHFKLSKKTLPYSHVMDNKSDRMLQRDFPAQTKLDQHLKDIALILKLSE